MNKERYSPSGEYYIIDNTFHKKISYKETIQLLNQKEQIIQGKSKTVDNLLKVLKNYEKTLKTMEDERDYYKNILKKLIG